MIIDIQGRVIELDSREFLASVEQVFKDDAEWFRRMCGLTERRASSQLPSPSSKP